jgi:hypothetical protein
MARRQRRSARFSSKLSLQVRPVRLLDRQVPLAQAPGPAVLRRLGAQRLSLHVRRRALPVVRARRNRTLQRPRTRPDICLIKVGRNHRNVRWTHREIVDLHQAARQEAWSGASSPVRRSGDWRTFTVSARNLERMASPLCVSRDV